MSILPALCEENPPVTSGSPNKGPLMLKVYYFDRNYTEKSFLGSKTFFWWPILLLQWRHNEHSGVSTESPALRLFTQPFIQEQVNKNIKAPRHRPLLGEFTGDQWIVRTEGL